jgi:hypothetical protein
MATRGFLLEGDLDPLEGGSKSGGGASMGGGSADTPNSSESPKQGIILSEESEMGRQVVVVLYVVAMAAVIVGVDFVFFRNQFWERLAVNIGIVLVFAAFYSRFLQASMNKAR